jgi:hypothetical protein
MSTVGWITIWLGFFGLTGAFIFSAGVFYSKTNTSIVNLGKHLDESYAQIKLYVELKFSEISERTEKRFLQLQKEMDEVRTIIQILKDMRREK